MKRIIFSGLTGLALASLVSLNATAGDVTVIVKQSDGTPLNGVSLRYQRNSSGTTTFLAASDNNNTAVRNVTAGSGHKFTASWKGTGFEVGPLTISDDDTTIVLYTAGVTFKATSHGNANVPGVSLRYTAGGSVTNQSGSTDANGEYAIEMFPGTYTYHKGINSTLQSASLTVGGSPYDANNTQTENITVTRVNFHNAGTVKYPRQGSVDGTIGTNFYMIPGTYNLRFKTGSNPTYSKDVVISGADYTRIASVIRLTDHNGDPLSIGSSRGGTTSINWHVTDAVSDQSPSVWIDIRSQANTNRIYEVTKNGTIATKTQDAATNNIFDFQTNLLTVRLQKCNGDGIEGGTIRVGSSSNLSATLNSSNINRHWSAMDVTSNSTDANGNSSAEVFPSAFYLEMTTSASVQGKLVSFTDNDTITWTTTKVKFKYPGAIAYGRSSISTHFPASKEAELLPGTFKFRFSTAAPTNAQFPSSQNIIDLEVPEQCTYELTPFLLRLASSQNDPLAAESMQYQMGSGPWADAVPSNIAGNFIALHPGIAGDASPRNYRVSYLGKALVVYARRINDAATQSAGQKYVFQTVLADVTFKSSEGADMTGTIEVRESVSPEVFVPFGDGNITGSKKVEVLPITGAYTFRIGYRGRTQSKTHNFSNNGNNVTFQTGKVTFIANDANDEALNGVTVSYRFTASSPYDTLGETGESYNGEISGEFLPINHHFRATYPGTSAKLFSSYSQITAGETKYIYLNYPDVNINIGATSSNFNLNISEVSLYPNPATEYVTVKVPVNNSVIEIYSIDGRKVQHINATSYINNVTISNLAAGTYKMVVSYEGKQEVAAFVKK